MAFVSPDDNCLSLSGRIVIMLITVLRLNKAYQVAYSIFFVTQISFYKNQVYKNQGDSNSHKLRVSKESHR